MFRLFFQIPIRNKSLLIDIDVNRVLNRDFIKCPGTRNVHVISNAGLINNKVIYSQYLLAQCFITQEELNAKYFFCILFMLHVLINLNRQYFQMVCLQPAEACCCGAQCVYIAASRGMLLRRAMCLHSSQQRHVAAASNVCAAIKKRKHL